MMESKREILKNNMLAFIAMQAFTTVDPSKQRSWTDGVRKVWKDYTCLEMGIELTESEEEDIQMAEAYTYFVKSLRPELTADGSGLKVSGLEPLFKAHGVDVEEKPDKPSNKKTKK